MSQYLGKQTNNFAEYQALIGALEYAAKHGPKALKVISDSELLVRQIKGIYKVKEPTLRDLHGRAKQLINQLEWFDIEHVLRGHNREADELANAAMDKGSGRTPFRPPALSPSHEYAARIQWSRSQRKNRTAQWRTSGRKRGRSADQTRQITGHMQWVANR